MSSLLVPNVVESTSRGERHTDLYSRLLSNRIVFIGQPLGPDLANLACAQLLHLAAEHDSEINLYINAPAADPSAMLAVYDTMQLVAPPVATTCFGHAVGPAALLVAAGAPGRRVALPHARFHLHQPGGEGRGQVSELLQASEEIERQRAELDAVLALHTGRDAEKVRADTDRDLRLCAHDALDYGLIDEVLQPSP